MSEGSGQQSVARRTGYGRDVAEYFVSCDPQESPLMRTKQCETGFTGMRRKRSGISNTKLVAGTLLWVAVFAMLGYVALKKLSGSNTAATQSEVVTTESQAETQTDPVQASTKTIRIGFPTRELPDFEFPECIVSFLYIRQA